MVVTWIRRRSWGSGKGRTNPALARRSTIAAMAGGFVPRAWARPLTVTGATGADELQRDQL